MLTITVFLLLSLFLVSLSSSNAILNSIFTQILYLFWELTYLSQIFINYINYWKWFNRDNFLKDSIHYVVLIYSFLKFDIAYGDLTHRFSFLLDGLSKPLSPYIYQFPHLLWLNPSFIFHSFFPNQLSLFRQLDSQSYVFLSREIKSNSKSVSVLSKTIMS